jgi:two-component system response regulator NreC
MQDLQNVKTLIRLIIADDHNVVREGLVSLLDREDDIEIVGQASTGNEVIAKVSQFQPDVVLLDINMPGINGLEAARSIQERHQNVKVLILTMHEESGFFFEALRAGAAGYILKGAHSDELLNAIRTIHRGGVYLSPHLAGDLVHEYIARHPETSPIEPLTPREHEVMLLIAKGFTNSEIADKLTLSINTIKTHRSNIYSKLGFNDRASLVGYAIKHSLLHS